MAIRVSIGATRFRLIRQLLTESVLLAFAGGLLGIAVAFFALRGVRLLGPQSVPRVNDLGMGLTALAGQGLAEAFREADLLTLEAKGQRAGGSAAP